MSSFKRTLGLQTTIAIVVGGVIGSGIFMKPAVMAQQLGGPLLLLSVWIVAGCVTLFGALSNAEVAAMYPETGGQYVFFKKMYGDAFAFMYGWAAFAVFNTAGNASIAYVCSQYTDYFVHLPRLSDVAELSIKLHIPFVGDIYPLQNIGVKLLTIILVIILSWINYYSVQYGGALQRVLTALKSLAILLLIGGILFSGKGDTANIFHAASNAPSGSAMIPAYIAAISGAFWAYDGWNNISFVAGEIKEPQRVIPRSLFTGLLFCIIVYALVNLAYLYVLPIEKLALSSFVASDAASMIWGGAGGGVIAAMVILSTLGTANGNILATARVTYAFGEENRLFAWAGKAHPRFDTPGNALWLNAIWSSILILSGSFDMLTDMLIFVTWFFYGMSALGVFILRKKYPDAERPYKVWGYPVITFLFVAFTAFFLVSTVVTDVRNYISHQSTIINSLLGICITCVGIPLYYLSKKK